MLLLNEFIILDTLVKCEEYISFCQTWNNIVAYTFAQPLILKTKKQWKFFVPHFTCLILFSHVFFCFLFVSKYTSQVLFDNRTVFRTALKLICKFRCSRIIYIQPTLLRMVKRIRVEMIDTDTDCIVNKFKLSKIVIVSATFFSHPQCLIYAGEIVYYEESIKLISRQFIFSLNVSK